MGNTKIASLQSKSFLIAALLITLIGFGIRIHNLGGDSLWLDEQLTLQTARLNFPDILTDARDHPPLMYVLTGFSIRTFGETEFGARLVSLFAGTLAIPLMILLGKVLRRPGVGLWAALFLAFSPFHLKYAQESRHYALLMLLSLATTTALALALTRPRIRFWILYGFLTALNLYVHYGAFIVLASQAVLILIWMVYQLLQRRRQFFWYPLVAAAVAALLYLPWIPYFLQSLAFNVGEDTVSDTGALAPMSEWLVEAFFKFGMYMEGLPYLILALACTGLLLLLWQREFLILSLLLSGLALPFVFIQIGSIARGAFVRYIIYVLPLYLFAAAIGPATAVQLIGRKHRAAGLSFAVLGALLFMFVGLRPVQSEHDHIQDDWQGIVQYLDQHANEGDLILGWSMSFANGFNTVEASLPYYLDRHLAKDLHLIPANRLCCIDLQRINENSSGQIWIVLYDAQLDQPALEKLNYTIEPFQSRLYILPAKDKDGPALERMIAIYEELIPLARKPSPSCLLQKDLALLYAETGDYIGAESLLSRALATCPERLSGEFVKYTLQVDVLKVIYEGALNEFFSQQDLHNARRIAGKLYELDPKNESALNVLTVFNLLSLYDQGQAEVQDQGSLEAVRKAEFLMPDSGDRGQALFIHPPSAVTFQLTLPQEATRFVSRVALDPQSWDWGGDGSTFVLTIRTEDGEQQELARLHVGSEADDRRWHDLSADLGAYAGQTVAITLRGDPGPNGDFSADWAGWETPRILLQADR